MSRAKQSWVFNKKFGAAQQRSCGNAENIPESMLCALTGDLMQDPVMDNEGNTYERAAITEWLSRSETSPITDNRLVMGDLVPNRALRSAIESRRDSCGGAGADRVGAALAELDRAGRGGAAAAGGARSAREAVRYNSRGEVVEAGCRDEEVGLQIFSSSTSSPRGGRGGAGDQVVDVVVSLQPKEGLERTPTDICLVVDTSSSMGHEASVGGEGNEEAHGLSLLDVVKHAIKTVIHTLGRNDRLSLVSFSSAAATVLELTAMNEAGKANALRQLATLQPNGRTNLWDGLKSGMDTLRTGRSAGRLSALLLLTDGQPNVAPPRGHVEMLRRYKDEHELTCPISTFGFGYNLDSALLHELADEGDGMYTFIPDSSFVGTAFVNCTSSVLATIASNATLSVETLNGATVVEDSVMGYSCDTTSWGCAVQLGTLQAGQSKDVVLKVRVPSSGAPYLAATLTCQHKASEAPFTVTTEASPHCGRGSAQDDAVMARNLFRMRAVACMGAAHEAMKRNEPREAKGHVDTVMREMRASPMDEAMRGLLEDLEGQVCEAISKREWFQKWGTHYLPSLRRAHLLQQCANFKDPGLQVYGGKLFQSLRDTADEIFINLPPPEPSVRPRVTPRGTAAPRATLVSMSSYYDRGGGCFSGECLVSMADGSERRVDSLTKGDMVTVPGGATASVRGVWKTVFENGSTELSVLPGGLRATPWHPVRVRGAWKFPQDLAPARETSCDAVYSFALDQGHVLLINGIECVGLAHGFTEPVVAHDYFGSNRITQDLASLPGWDKGMVTLKGGCLLRDASTGLVNGLDPKMVVLPDDNE